MLAHASHQDKDRLGQMMLGSTAQPMVGVRFSKPRRSVVRERGRSSGGLARSRRACTSTTRLVIQICTGFSGGL